MTFVWEFIFEHRWEIIFAILFAILAAVIIEIIFKPFRYICKKRKALKALYDVRKKSSSLKPEEILGIIRGKTVFHEYYHVRKHDDDVKKKIESNSNVLITGTPLSGKSRTIYQALIALDKPHSVILPRLADIQNIEDFIIPSSSRKKILVLNDFDKYAEKQNFLHLLQEFLKRDVVIIASCRSRQEYDSLCRYLEKSKIDISSIFGEPIEISKITKEQGSEVARKTGRDLPPTFDGNIGSIFINLDTMRQRYRDCDGIEKGILKSIRSLYYAGIYNEREIFSFEKTKHICKTIGIDKESYEWDGLLKGLNDKGFIEIENEGIRVEETYLQSVIGNGLSLLDNFQKMLALFSNDAEALFRLGNKAYTIGTIDLEKIRYMKITITACTEALKVYTLEKFPMDYAMTQNNLGNAYGTLAEVKDKAENCGEAITAYTEALKVYTKDFPEPNRIILSNLKRLEKFCKET